MADEKTFTKDELDAAVAKAVESATGDVDGLKGKIEELIADNKKWKTEARKAKEIDPAEVERLHAEVEELGGKLTAAETAAKAADKARDAAVKALEGEQGYTQKLLIQDGIKSGLLANGVKDEDFIDSLSAKFAAGASIVTEGDARKAMYGDKPLQEFLKDWTASDAGKKFVAAPSNSGGGAPGGDGKGAGKTMARTAFDGMDPAAKVAFAKDGGTVVDAG